MAGEVGPEPLGGAVPEDGYFSYPKCFLDPLPASLATGLPTRPPPPTASDVAKITELLQSATGVNGKEHAAAVSKKPKTFLKRPAAFPHGGLVAGVAGPLAKRPATAPHGGLVAGVGDDVAVFENCKAVLKDPLGDAREVQTVYTLQRGTHIFQLKDKVTRKAFCQATDRQFGSKETAGSAIAVLLKLAVMGASHSDLRRVKQSGKLFGISCGMDPAIQP